MRCLLILVPMVLLAGCEQSFDAQYTDTEKQLKDDAAALDKDMATAAKKEPGETQ